jgi:hypothetical protein
MKRKKRRRKTSVRDNTKEEGMERYKRWKGSKEEKEVRYNI